MDEGAARTEFFAQAGELIDSLFADLQALRASAAAGRERRALLDRLFRHAHTLKGSASLLDRADAPGPNPVTQLAHELEDLLDSARARRVPLDADALDACEDAADALSRAVEAAARGETPQGPPGALVERLRRLARGAAAAAGSRAAESLPAEVASALGAAERARVAEAAGEGARLVSVEVGFGLSELDERFGLLTAALEASCEILATLPGAGTDAPGRISFRLICATREGPDELARSLAGFAAQLRTLLEPGAAGDDSSDAAATTEDATADGSAADGPTTEDATAAAATTDATTGGAAGDASAAAGASDTVRVPIAELDELVFAADELFDDALAALAEGAAALAEQATAATAEGGTAAPAEGDTAARLEDSAARLRQKFLALSERVLALRMQTLARPLELAARAARAAARASGKRVEVEVSGGAARLDRSVAERIAEPLAHLVRNAVAHGIESPAERAASGKDGRGRVRLAAVTEGARVRVTVSDDGRGIDPERIARAAREQGLVPEGARVSEEQALRLIFRPGFSTAGRVSETAGRGVGLDAVEHEIELAGGEVRVYTRRGRGTTFELRLPLALAFAPAVIVRARGQTYALDADQIADAGRLDPAALSPAGQQTTALWRGRRLPFARLDALLKLPPGGEPRGASEGIPFVVVRAAAAEDAAGEVGAGDAQSETGAGANESRAARACVVAVDEVVGRRDALVRSLGRHATRWRGTSGAIDLRDGTAALMLDLPRLLEGMSNE